MSLFVLDASYALTWCFADRATPNTDAALRRLESHADTATVPWVWQVEVANALGKAVSRAKIPLPRALEIWDELLVLPIRQTAVDTRDGLGTATRPRRAIFTRRSR